MFLFSSVARVLVKYAGNAAFLGFGGDAILEIWDQLSKSAPDEKQKLAEVERVASRSAEETRQDAKRVAAEEAGDKSEALQQTVATYLTQLPAAVRCSLKRPNDPTGKTIPPGVMLRNAEDLRKFLPSKLAKFKPGDRPLPGVDWELEELLGVGGFGEVWKARNPDFGGIPPVALKFCLDKEIAGSLRHEAAMLSQVMSQGTDGGIVRLLHSYLKADPPCLEYEYIPGGDLTGLIHDWHSSLGGCKWQTVAEMMVRLAEIVGFAHRLPSPIVHRDLKPANILVQKGEGGHYQLKVTDFGIGGLAARQTMKEAAEKPAYYMTAMATGTCTPLYASPQQKRGERADPRDDVFSLGVIWHQGLTGNTNDEAPTGGAWQRKLADRGMPSDLVKLLESCVESDAQERPSDAAQLAIFLKRKLNPEPPPPPPAETVKSQCPQCKSVLKIRADVPATAKFKCPKCAHIFMPNATGAQSAIPAQRDNLAPATVITIQPVVAGSGPGIPSRALSSEQVAVAVNVMRKYLEAPANSEGKTPCELSAKGDNRRVELIEAELKPLMAAYLTGKVPLNEYKSKIDGINKRNENWGFKGIKGQMFFNMVVNVAPDAGECDKEIKAAILVPTNEDMSRSRIRTFEQFVQRIGDAYVAKGGTKQGRPKPGSIPFFLSYFWQIQDRRTWPVYYTNSVNKMVELNLWQPTDDLADSYVTYKQVHEELAEAFKNASGQPFDLYKVEHVFWFGGGNIFAEPPGASPDSESGYCFVNVGEGDYRNWDDCRNYGFLSAGGGAKYSDPFKKLQVGDKVFAYMKSLGYVGYGEISRQAVMLKDFSIDGQKTLLDLPLMQQREKEHPDDPNLAEWAVGVKWLRSFPKEEARTFSGAFANQWTVCQLRDERTLDFLKKEFGIDSSIEWHEPEDIRRRFWEKLLNRKKIKDTRHANLSPGDSNWISAGSGVRGCPFVYVVGQDDARVELYIDRGKDQKDTNKRIFDGLQKLRNEIDSCFGQPQLSWQRLDDKRACRIAAIFSTGGYKSDESKWPKIQIEMIDAMARLEKAVLPHLAKLTAESDSNSGHDSSDSADYLGEPPVSVEQMQAQWHYAQGNNKVGPLNTGELRNLVRDGIIQPNTMVIKAGTTRWLEASSVRNLPLRLSKARTGPQGGRATWHGKPLAN